jgi:hypothetical protein
MMAYSNFNSPFLQEFLDEAIWRRKYKLFPDRVEFLVQMNQSENYNGDENVAMLRAEPYRYIKNANAEFDGAKNEEESPVSMFNFPELDAYFGRKPQQSSSSSF